MIRTRIAPTPSGYLHLGNIFSFVLTWLVARKRQGHLYLRIDDLDSSRFRKEYLTDIFESLHWLGIDWDAGPKNESEFLQHYTQKNRLPRYAEVLHSGLLNTKIYACECSLDSIRLNPNYVALKIYPKTCRKKNLKGIVGQHTLRYCLSESEELHLFDERGQRVPIIPYPDIGDFIVRQKQGNPSYQLASVVDDEDLGITFIVRGLDLKPSTGAQMRLANDLGFTSFPQVHFWHHGLVEEESGKKLSKSEGSESLRSLRRELESPQNLFRWIARQLGINPAMVHSIQDLLPDFKIERLSPGPWRLSEMRQQIVNP